MQKYFLLLILINSLINDVLADKPKILVSTAPIAGIVEMITGDEFVVEAINIPNGCPHHYHAKPSDKAKLDSSDIAIYIDDNFDGFFASLLRNYQGNIIKISDMGNFNMLNNGNSNWHFWLDLDKIKHLMDDLAQKIILYYPEKTELIKKNLASGKQSLSELQQEISAKQLSNFAEIILLTSSAEHFFFANNMKYRTLFKSNYSSLQFAKKLEDSLTDGVKKCFVIAPHQAEFKKNQDHKNFIIIDAENWQLDSSTKNYAQLFYVSYKKIIDLLDGCKSF